ncbi:MAG: 2-C-methyl-D-erythritol 4-phosphate cytidylyltransferase [Nocardioides sp.]
MARESGGAVPVVSLPQVVARDGRPHGERLVAVQTPQAFRAEPLLAAYRAADADGFQGTDTSASVERFAAHVRIVAVPGHQANAKITFAADLPVGQA